MSQTETETRTVREEERVEEEEQYKIIGTRQARYDSNLKVSGSAVFGTDVHLPNMLYGKIFRSTLTHAKIVKLDVSNAERYPGVRAVVTSRDFPDVTYGFAVRDQTFLPKERVLYQGQPVCALAADTLEIAERSSAVAADDASCWPDAGTIDQNSRRTMHACCGPQRCRHVLR